VNKKQQIQKRLIQITKDTDDSMFPIVEVITTEILESLKEGKKVVMIVGVTFVDNGELIWKYSRCFISFLDGVLFRQAKSLEVNFTFLYIQQDWVTRHMKKKFVRFMAANCDESVRGHISTF